MKTREKLVILLSILIVFFILSFNFLRNTGEKALILLFQKEMADKHASFEKIIELKEKPLKDMVDVCTYWDEMVNFIYFKDMQWAKKNINEALSSFNTNAAWVYSPDFTLVYSTNNMGDDEIKELSSVPKKFLYEYFLKQQNRFLHFFTVTKSGILEIRAASIHPTADPQRTTLPRGFFFVAKLWDADYINDLSNLTDSHISLNIISEEREKTNFASPEKGIIYFSRTLPRWDGKDFAQIEVKIISESIISFNAMSNKYSIFFLIFAAVFIASISVAIITWIIEPLHLISVTLKNKDINFIKKLSAGKTEFGEISRMIEIYFKQRETLEEEINVRRKIENALRASKESFHNIVERSEDGIIIVDATNVVKFFNNAASEFLNNETLFNKPFFLDPNKHRPVEIDLIRSNGQQVTGEVITTKTYWEGIDASLIYIRDITEQKKLENNQRLTEFGKLLADIAHEINNPLMIISGETQIALTQHIDNAEFKKSLKIIIGEIDRAKIIMQKLYQLGMSCSSKRETKMINIHKTFDEVIALIEHPFKLSNIEIKKAYMTDPPFLQLDEKQMQEVFLNLLNNAKEAMPKGGAITITTSLQNKSFRIDFSDTGCGIAETAKKRIFEPFYTTKDKGIELGLSICYNLVKANNGELTFDSSEGKGTTFNIVFQA